MKLLITSATIFYIISFNGFQGAPIDNGFGNIGNQLVQNLLSPLEALRGSRQLLLGLPEMAIFGTIHKMCSLSLSSGMIDSMVTPDIEEIYFQLRTPCDTISFPVKHANNFFETEQFDVNKPVILFISGWNSNIESDSITQVAKAYNCRGGYNFLALDASYFIDTLYTWSALNTEAVGHFVAYGLAKLYRKVPAKNIHLIGFSLGAHIAGFAARYFKEYTGVKIQRITGLDPANPCFGQRSLPRLQRGDANFVDIIHTNPGALGERDALGNIDFYVEGYAPIKPGCVKLGCSHTRAWKYYAESVYPGHEKDFLANKCNNAVNDYCKGSVVAMGLNTSFYESGSFTLNVNPQVPYGQNSQYNGDLIYSQCGFCDF